MPAVLNASFHTTVARLADLPAGSRAEVAFAGRSNAGKSSAINMLANQKRLAFVSKTPGRTQHLNFFRVGTECFLVDLPGYGYARAPQELQRTWHDLVGEYMASRQPLRGLVLIMDVRHPLTELDIQLLLRWRQTGKPVHVLLSKSDKLSHSQGLKAMHLVDAYLKEAGVPGSVQLFSALKRQGLDAAESVVRLWLEMPKKNPAQGDKAG